MSAFFARCAVSAVCFMGASVVAYSGNDGWGWLIFAGLLAIPSIQNYRDAE